MCAADLEGFAKSATEMPPFLNQILLDNLSVDIQQPLNDTLGMFTLWEGATYLFMLVFMHTE